MPRTAVLGETLTCYIRFLNSFHNFELAFLPRLWKQCHHLTQPFEGGSYYRMGGLSKRIKCEGDVGRGWLGRFLG